MADEGAPGCLEIHSVIGLFLAVPYFCNSYSKLSRNDPDLCFRAAVLEANQENFGQFEEVEVEECLEMKEAQEMSPRPLKEKQEAEKGEDRRRLANSDPVAFEELYKVSVVVVALCLKMRNSEGNDYSANFKFGRTKY